VVVTTNECIIHVDYGQCEISASYLSDALGKLMLADVARPIGVTNRAPVLLH
jgi:hypothetical protein